MKIKVRITSDEPNYKELNEEKAIPLPAFMLTKKVQKEAFDLMKYQLKEDIISRIGETEVTVDIDTDTEYQFHFTQNGWTRTCWAGID